MGGNMTLYAQVRLPKGLLWRYTKSISERLS